MKHVILLAAVAALVGCSASGEPVTKDGLVAALKDADLGIIEVTEEDPSKGGMVPGGYQHHLSIVLEEVAPKGGQFFICDETSTCDQVKGYFDSLANLAGPHRYQSTSGHVVAQLNSGVSQETADRIVTVLDGM